MSKIDLNEYKSLVPKVKDAVQKTLKVSAGTQSAYDIMAASRGFPNFHAVRAQSKYPYFELKANLGKRQEPFFITLEVGHQIDLGWAEIEARKLLKGCQQFQTWFLYRDGENTHIKFETSPEPEKGLVYQIEVTGDTEEDADQALLEVIGRIDNVQGFDRNETSSYSFRRVGEECSYEFDPLNDLDVMTGKGYALIDGAGVVMESDGEQAIEEALNFANDDIEDWSEFLAYACEIAPDVLFENSENEFDDGRYILIRIHGRDKQDVIRGSSGDVVEAIKESPGLIFQIYEEIRSVEGSKNV